MSFLPPGITVLAANALSLLTPILFMQRNIGGFIADVTLSEDHTDELRVTEKPVEQGASVTDHAYKVPARLVVHVGYSNSSLTALGNPFYVQMVYDSFLNLQSSLEPFSVTTGKRVYENMLITRLGVVTDEKTENALDMTVEMQEIIIVSTQVVQSGTGSGNPANMSSPVNTSAVTNRGSVNVIERGPDLPNISGPVLFR